VAAQVRTRRQFHRHDGSVIDLGEVQPSVGRPLRRHRRRPARRFPGGRLAAGLGRWLRTTDESIDKGLTAVTFLVTAGVIFFAFGMGSWYFNDDTQTGWTLWLLGLGMWILAMAIFFYFLNDPYPRHRKDS
jgi:hypothetical protein